MKGSLAAMMLVGAAAVREGFRGDVIVTAVADEEVGSVGPRLCHSAPPPTPPSSPSRPRRSSPSPTRASSPRDRDAGVCRPRLRPDVGIDAIAAMGPVLSGIAALDAELRVGGAHLLLGTGSLHASVIEGGRSTRATRLTAGCRRAPHCSRRDGRRCASRARGDNGRNGRDREAPLPPRAIRDGAGCRRGAGAAASSRPGRDRRGRVLGRFRLIAGGIQTVLFGPSSAASTGSTSGSISPRSSVAAPHTSPSRGSCVREAVAGGARGSGAVGGKWAEAVAAAPGYELVGVADAAATGRAWVEEALAVPTIRDLGRAISSMEPTSSCGLAALDAPAARRTRPRRRLHVIVEKPLR